MHLHPQASGAPIFNSDGNVIGVGCASYDGHTDFSAGVPIGAIFPMHLKDININGKVYDKITIKELIELKYILCS